MNNHELIIENPLLQEIQQIVEAKSFSEIKDSLIENTMAVTDILESQGSPTLKKISSDLPTLLIFDIHGRRRYIYEAMQHKIKDKFVIELLQDGLINVVCLGDGMHTEDPNEWSIYDTKIKDKQLLDSFGVMLTVQKLLLKFPNFNYLAGNHDDLADELFKFNIPINYYIRNGLISLGIKDFIEKYIKFESNLPFILYSDHFVASHAMPDDNHPLEFLSTRSQELRESLTWTDNTYGYMRLFQPRIEYIFNQLGIFQNSPTWFIGHRYPDYGFYRTQCDGKLVQAGHREYYITALIHPFGEDQFNPENGIFELPVVK